jgi:hypothetical protein
MYTPITSSDGEEAGVCVVLKSGIRIKIEEGMMIEWLCGCVWV